jgi:2-methylcitrate dehydratase PrpD
MNTTRQVNNEIEDQVSAYISGCSDANPPDDVIVKAKQSILDSLAAVVSGSSLKPGLLARQFAESQGGKGEVTLVGSKSAVPAINAAFAHGMMGHADETDDYQIGCHAGCVVVPAALAMAEREGADGISFLKAVVAGYDIACRIVQALGISSGPHNPTMRDSFSISGHFGAMAAVASLACLKPEQVRYALSYTAQQVSGITSWFRDEEHIEKAFVFAGMPARNAVNAAILVQSGFTGVQDALSGKPGFFVVFALQSKPELLVNGLGIHYEIMNSYIKKYSVGAPIMAPVDAMLMLMEKHKFSEMDVEHIAVHLPESGAKTVNNRKMPDINVQHILAITLLDKSLSFASSHSYERMSDPAVLQLKNRISLHAAPELSTPDVERFQGIVEVTTKDGSKLREHVKYVSGNPKKPMTMEEIERKGSELLSAVLGADRAKEVIDRVMNLEKVGNMREFRQLLCSK